MGSSAWYARRAGAPVVALGSVLGPVLRPVLGLVLGLVLTGCSSTVDGAGSGGSGTGVSSSASPSGPSASPDPSRSPGVGASSGSTSRSSARPSPSATYQTVTVTGTSSGRPITVRVYAQDMITDCAAHAYGATMIRFLGAHPCHAAKRVLGTSVVGGRTVVLSIISTGFDGTAQDPYVYAGRFQQLEKADGTGSINDLLREGRTIPGVAGRIPEHEVFQVVGQDQAVTIFDAWYRTGSTGDQDATLRSLEIELFLTSLTTG